MKILTIGPITVAAFDAEGPQLTGEGGAIEVIGAVYGTDADWVAVPLARLAPSFFGLANKEAGGFFQKLTNYRLKAAIIGDISGHTAKSSALRDFVRECNEGGAIRFAPTFEDFAAGLVR